jgi:RNA polymerase sigma-70 factor (ECF subfamily)
VTGRSPSFEKHGPAWDDEQTLDQLRRGDEGAFARLVDRHASAMLGVAEVLVGRADAEAVVVCALEELVGRLEELDPTVSLKVSLVRAVQSTARPHQADGQGPAPTDATAQDDGEPGASLYGKQERWADHWLVPPRPFQDVAGDGEFARLARAAAERALSSLPPAERQLVLLRDREGWTSDDVCELFDTTPEEERFVLHAARMRIRRTVAGIPGIFAP